MNIIEMNDYNLKLILESVLSITVVQSESNVFQHSLSFHHNKNRGAQHWISETGVLIPNYTVCIHKNLKCKFREKISKLH